MYYIAYIIIIFNIFLSNENQQIRKIEPQHYRQEKESSKDSAYGYSGGETSRMGNPHTREPTPEEKAGSTDRYKRPNSRYSSSHARYRRYHKVRGNNKDTRNRHTSSSRSDDERLPEKSHQNQLTHKKRIQHQLKNRKYGMIKKIKSFGSIIHAY